MKAALLKRLAVLEAGANQQDEITIGVRDLGGLLRLTLRSGRELRGPAAERALERALRDGQQSTGGILIIAGVDPDLVLGLKPHPDPRMREPEPCQPSAALAGQDGRDDAEGLPQWVGEVGEVDDLTPEEAAMIAAFEPTDPPQPVEVSEPAAGELAGQEDEEPLDVESFFPPLPSGLGWRE